MREAGRAARHNTALLKWCAPGPGLSPGTRAAPPRFPLVSRRFPGATARRGGGKRAGGDRAERSARSGPAGCRVRRRARSCGSAGNMEDEVIGAEGEEEMYADTNGISPTLQ